MLDQDWRYAAALKFAADFHGRFVDDLVVAQRRDIDVQRGPADGAIKDAIKPSIIGVERALSRSGRLNVSVADAIRNLLDKLLFHLDAPP
jgi:hypothetical protein